MVVPENLSPSPSSNLWLTAVIHHQDNPPRITSPWGTQIVSWPRAAALGFDLWGRGVWCFHDFSFPYK